MDNSSLKERCPYHAGLINYTLLASLFSNSLLSTAEKTLPEPSKKRKCSLPGCNVEYVPSWDNQCCCCKEHFLKLKEIQKERNS